MSLRDNRVIIVCLIAAMFAIFSVAHADETTAKMSAPTSASVPAAPEDSAMTAAAATVAAPASAGSNVVEEKSSNLLSHLGASYFATFHGPSLNNMGTGETVDNNGKLSSQAMYLDSEVDVNYMITDKIGVGPVLPFLLYTAKGQSAAMGDAGFRIIDTKTVSTNDFNLYTNLIFQLPTSDYSKARGMDFSIKSTPNVRYTIHNTRYTLGAWTEIKSYLGATSGKLFKLYAAPYLNYQLTSKLSLNLEYEMEADHFAGPGSSTNFQMYQNDIMPGVVYFITPKVMLNPYLQVFTGSQVSSDRMALGAIISASI